MALSKDEILEAIKELPVIDLAGLVKDLEEEFGVSAAAAAPVAVAGGAAPAAESAAEEKSEFDVELTSVGDKKINVIKVIREITSLGLKEAKEMADNAPSVVKEAAPKEEAEEVKKKLEEAGATVTLK